MRHREIVRTTLGDLITAVADEVTASMDDSPEMYILIAYIVSDLLSKRSKDNGVRKINCGSLIFPRRVGSWKAGLRI
jgi:hypothetical protein